MYDEQNPPSSANDRRCGLRGSVYSPNNAAPAVQPVHRVELFTKQRCLRSDNWVPLRGYHMPHSSIVTSENPPLTDSSPDVANTAEVKLTSADYSSETDSAGLAKQRNLTVPDDSNVGSSLRLDRWERDGELSGSSPKASTRPSLPMRRSPRPLTMQNWLPGNVVLFGVRQCPSCTFSTLGTRKRCNRDSFHREGV